MTVRRAAAALAIPLALLACAPEVEQEASPQEIVKAVFDSATATIPLPNDLALQAAAATPGGTGALLQLFVGGGGWPNDQEVAIDVPIQSLALQADGSYAPATSPATIDLATVNASTVALLRIDSGTPVAVPFEAAYAPLAGSFGNLRLRTVAAADGSRHWAPGGRYVVAVRGGASGVRTAGGRALSADLVTSFITQGKDLTVEEFQPPGLPPALAGQLEQLRQLYVQPLTWTTSGTSWIPQSDPDLPAAFEAVETVFPVREIASIQTFGVEDGTHVAADPAAGQIPLPSDFLLDPSTGKVQYLPDAFGPAAAGLATLDGFSTTAILLAPTTGPIDADSVSRSSVLVFETGGAFPVWLHDLASALAAGNPGLARYLTQPPQLNADVGGTTVSSTIGLQPAIPVTIPGVGSFFLPPLAEHTTHVVVVTDRVLDAEGNPLRRGTLGKLLFTYEGDLADLPILDAETAAGLEALRDGLEPLLANLAALTGDPTLTKDDVVMAYPVTTQTVTEVSVGLSALPYDPDQDGDPADSVIFAPQTAATFDPEATFGFPAGSFPGVAAFYQSVVVTLDAIDVTTGALQPNPALWTPEPITALVAVPDPASVPPCPGAEPGPPFCAPLVVLHHGLGGGRYTALAFASSLAARGFVVAAVDAPYHGDRAFCETSAECNPGGTCTPIPGAEGQGDAVPPGTCDTGLAYAGLTTAASGNYFVSANFFRTRDAIRQDLLDHAALVLALARPPDPFPQPAANPLAEALLSTYGIVIDPTRVYLDGLSLGGVIGTQIAAANPRFSRAVLSVAGATVVDALTNAPAFDAAMDALFLEAFGIDRDDVATDPAVAARYLQILLVAKWVLDPAEPLNYAANVPTKLASPLHAAGLGPLASLTTDAYGQVANCDDVIPNPFNLLLYENAGIPYTFYASGSAPGGCVPHGFLGTSADGQGHAAQFLLDLTNPGPTFTLP
jgi:dienelactone hydrolase